MKKSLVVAFLVSWAVKSSQNIVPCPNTQAMIDQNTGITYANACIQTTPPTETHEFKTKKEAQSYVDALKMLHGIVAEVKEKK